MKITWSIPVPGAALDSGRGDLVRATALIAAVREAGHDVMVVHAGARGSATTAVSAYRGLVRKVLPDPLALTLRDVGRAAHSRVHARRVIAAAREQNADLIIETQVHLTDSGAVAARTCGIPLVLDDCSPVSEEAALGGRIQGLTHRMFAAQARAANALTVSSPTLQERFVRDGVPQDKIAIVGNGVDLTPYRVASRSAVRMALGLGPEPVVVFAGSFQPWHQVTLLVEALACLTPLPQLLLLGDGPGLAEVLARADVLGLRPRITSLGALPPARMPELLTACDIGVLPGSNDYGQPMKLLEYAAAGLAIVAPDLAPVRAIILDGNNGVLFRPNDVTALAAALQCVTTNAAARARFGAQARARIADTATWLERGQELAHASAQVLRRRAGGLGTC
ncbi:MAG TPA: glycosyltransferase [Gemmatimonadaceae bacterium]|nr:glycosyltransferase [Gemmatimonadaceae bacterium]